MWPNPQETVDLVTFAEEILNGKLYFLCSVSSCVFFLKHRGLITVYLIYQSNQSKMNTSKNFGNISTSKKAKVVI